MKCPLNRLNFAEINFYEIDFCVDFFSRIQLCHTSRGFAFPDGRILITSPELLLTDAKICNVYISSENRAKTNFWKITKVVFTESIYY